jgi:hypothetical protein
MLRPLLLLLLAYAALYVHRNYMRDEALPVEASEASARESIRQNLAQESAIEGPLTEAFETVYERRQQENIDEVPLTSGTVDSGAFAFLRVPEDNETSFLMKLATYAESDAAQDANTQADVLAYALSRPERGHNELYRIALSALGQVEVPRDDELPPSSKRILELSVRLLAKQARDAYELERIKLEVMGSRPEDAFVQALDEAFAAALRE